MRLILASGSPRRKQLLETLNIPFEIIVSDAEENINQDKDLNSEIERLSFLKASSVFEKNKDATVIGSDTIVTINNKVLGKPKDEEDAKNMLKILSDNKHTVITAVTIMNKNKVDTFSVNSDVYFYPLSEKEIDDYIKTNEPMDKAGAYAIQGLGSKFIKKIDGDYYAIMGFPIGEVYHRLEQFKKKED